jgi:hypothetical protein
MWPVAAALALGSVVLLLLGRRALAEGRVWSKSFWVHRAERPEAFRFTVTLYFVFAAMAALAAIVVTLFG